MIRNGTTALDYRRLILSPDRDAFLAYYPLDVTATTDDRPFFFHTTRLRDQFQTAFGRTMLFGNGLSALLTLFGISAILVVLFIVVPLALSGGRPGPGWGCGWPTSAALGAGFMLLEVALLQRFVLLLGHPVYSLTVTLFSLLLGTGTGSFLSRRVSARAGASGDHARPRRDRAGGAGLAVRADARHRSGHPVAAAVPHRDGGRHPVPAGRAARRAAARRHAPAGREAARSWCPGAGASTARSRSSAPRWPCSSP